MSENDMAKIARLVADPHADARAEVQGLLVEHERLTLELIATRARVAELEDAGENVIIAFSMGWDMDGVIEVLCAALSETVEA